MTTMSVMVALMPIASGLEEGSELLQAAAVVLIGGLLTSTLLTLVFVPAMYTIFDDMQAGVVRMYRWLTRSAPAPEPAGATAASGVPAAGHASAGSHAFAPADSRAGHDGRREPDGRPSAPAGAAAPASGPRRP